MKNGTSRRSWSGCTDHAPVTRSDGQNPPQADADLTDIWSYIARDNPPAADKLIRHISDAFDLLAANPDIGIRQDGIRPGLRCKPVKRRYLVFYEVAGDTLHILRVLHGARKYEDLL